MTQRTFGAAAAMLLLASCRITGPPDPHAGLGPRASVYAPVVSEEIGELFAETTGLWAFRTPEPARAKTYTLGMLVAFGDIEQADRNLFAVVETAAWGVRLQRLDPDPISGRTSGTLIPLTQLDRQTAARWGFCAGDEELATAECLEEAPAGTRWWVYEMSEDGRIPTRASTDATLPIPLRGLVGTSPLGRDVLGVDLPDRWLAVPSTALRPRPTRPRIVVDEACDVGSPHRDALDAQWVRASVAPPTDPLTTSSEAVRLGADALVSCDGPRTRVDIPTLYRPTIDVIGRGFAIPPMLGAQTIEVPPAARAHTDWIARMGAAVATGDFATVDYLADELARVPDKSRVRDRVLVDSMTAIAFGGRPEAAARLGGWATRLQWNPQNSAAWQIGMSEVEVGLGNRKAAIARTAGLQDVLDRLGDDGRRAWVAYFWAVSQIRARGAAQDYLTPLEGHVGLQLAARAEAATPDTLDGLAAEFESAGAKPLHRALAGAIEPLGCDVDSCAADVYGALWKGGGVDAAALSRVGRSDLRPGYGPRHAAASELGTLHDLTAVFPLVADEQADDLLQLASATAVSWVRAGCKAGEDDMARLRNLGEDARLRTTDQPLDATMVWLATQGVDSACSDTSTLAAAAVELAEQVGLTTVPTDFLALHIEKASEAEIAGVLAAAAKFAIEYERGDRCATWTVALAAAHADAGHYESAMEWIQHGTRCDVPDRQNIDLVSAYLNFQRTSTTSADFAAPTRAALRTVVHVDVPADTCVGLATLDYRIIPALPAHVRELAVRVRLAPAKRGEELSLVTASDQLANAREHLRDVQSRLDGRAFADAAASLQHARSAFEGVGHEVGLARVRWLERLLFAGTPAPDADLTKLGLIAELAKRKAPTFTERAKADGDARLALALLQDDVGTASDLATNKTPHRDALCQPSPRSIRNVAIENIDGKLQDVRGRDDGPEIELVEPPVEP